VARIRDQYILDIDVKNAANSLNTIKTGLGALAGAFAINEVGQFVGDIVEATTTFERFQTVLTTYLGSQQAANKELERLQQLANSLPQDLQDITESFLIFQRYGLDTTNAGLREFSNIATANGKSLEQLAEALGDALTGEFERLKEFGIKVTQENGQILARIGDQQVAVARTSSELVDQLQELGSTRFGGAAEINADTLRQSLSNLRGAVFEAQVAFGEGLKPALKDVSDEFATILRANDDLAESLGAGVGEALRTLADVAILVSENINVVRNAFLAFIGIKAVSFIANIAEALTFAAAGAGSLADKLKTMAVVAINFIRTGTGLSRILALFAGLANPIGLIVTGIAGATLALNAYGDATVELNSITTSYGEIASAVWFKLTQAVNDLATAVSETLVGAFESFTSKFDALATAIATTFNFVFGDLLEKLGIDSLVENIKQGTEDIVVEYRKHQEAVEGATEATDEQALAQQRAAEAAARVAAEQEKINTALEKQRDANAANIREFSKSLDKTREEFEFRTSLIGLTEQQKTLEEQRFRLQQSLASAIVPLQEKIIELEKLGTEEAQARIGVIRDTIGVLRDRYDTELLYIEQIVAARNEAIAAQERQESIDEARLTAAEAVLETEERIRRAREDVSLEGFTGIRRELKEIELQEKRIAREAKARVRAQLAEGVDASVVNAELQAIDSATQESIRAQQEIAEQAYENSRTFARGWREAFEEYQDSATDASRTAAKVFETATKGMEDAIVGFARTGKFEFRGFINSILEELLRSQVRQLIARTFSFMGGGSQGGGGGGLGSLFAGFFATGGQIPPGRFGIVGEAGPEVVTGPANVTPVGSTTINYNINAVDAMSFKQMVAQDPGFIYAVTEQGRKTIPGGRR